MTAEYALRAVVCLAELAPNRATTDEIASITQVPRSYLSKVLDALVRGGIAVSHRGAHGGFELAASPRRLTALDVINAVDPLQRIDGCPLGLPEHAKGLCPLHRQLDDAIAMAEGALAAHTIAELIGQNRARGERMHFPTT